jgi:hypothetical protein
VTARANFTGDAELEAAFGEADRLRLQVATLLATHQQLATLLVVADTRAGDMMKLLVAVRVLIESRDAAAALDSLRDILVNVIGTNDFAIYSLDSHGKALVPIAVVGEAMRTADRMPLDKGWIGEVVSSGDLLIEPEGGSSRRRGRIPEVAAVVPLKVLDRIVGAIVIARMLPHRELLGACDREILALLGVYAATAIIAADRRAGWRELPGTLR